jgi:hypothetical protein
MNNSVFVFEPVFEQIENVVGGKLGTQKRLMFGSLKPYMLPLFWKKKKGFFADVIKDLEMRGISWIMWWTLNAITCLVVEGSRGRLL